MPKGIKKKANPEYDRVKHPVYDYFDACQYYLRRWRKRRKPRYFYQFCSACISLYDQISEIVKDDDDAYFSDEVEETLKESRMDLSPNVGRSKESRKRWSDVWDELKSALKTLRLTDPTVGKLGDVEDEELYRKT